MSVSGLPPHRRIVARHRFVQALELALHHAPQIHYSQGDQRWQGIDHKLDASKGMFPSYADCSAMVSWADWNALFLTFKMPDIVNDEDWRGGWTGTLCQHGREIIHPNRNAIAADKVFYGTGAPWHHVAGIVGRHKGKLMVISHGSEAGPLYLPIDYRSDVGEIRRYI